MTCFGGSPPGPPRPRTAPPSFWQPPLHGKTETLRCGTMNARAWRRVDGETAGVDGVDGVVIRRVGFRAGTDAELRAQHRVESEVNAERRPDRAVQPLESYMAFARNL